MLTFFAIIGNYDPVFFIGDRFIYYEQIYISHFEIISQFISIICDY